MFKTLLVPLDGSLLAERALPLATALARADGGKLILLRAVPAIGAGAPAVWDLQSTADMEALVAGLRAQGLPAEAAFCHVYATDGVADAILERARDDGADAIVLASHGRGGIGRWWFGSVADAVIRNADRPVIVVPATCERSWPGGRSPRLLVPLDGSELAAQALQLAAGLAELTGAELHLVRVVEPLVFAYAEGYAYVQDDSQAMLAEARNALEQAAAPLRAAGRHVEVHTDLGSPAQIIADLAREREIDLLVLATHGRGGLARVILGSVATGLLSHAAVPLLALRPVEEAAKPAATVSTPRAADATTASPAEATASVALTAPEIELIRRGLSELLYPAGV